MKQALPVSKRRYADSSTIAKPARASHNKYKTRKLPVEKMVMTMNSRITSDYINKCTDNQM